MEGESHSILLLLLITFSSFVVNEIVSVLMRFRSSEFGCSSDIFKMRLYKLSYARWTEKLWPDNPFDINSKINVYLFHVVFFFGATCSQFLSNLCKEQHIEN